MKIGLNSLKITKMIENNVIEIIPVCQICKREVPDGSIFYQHEKYGIVCEYCPEFEDGGITPVGDED